jgi:hypothetical protein
MVKGIPQAELAQQLDVDLEPVKWYLWHGNVFMALQVLEGLHIDLTLDNKNPATNKLEQAVREFGGYIVANKAFIPNYGDRPIVMQRQLRMLQHHQQRLFFSLRLGNSIISFIIPTDRRQQLIKFSG